MDYHYEVFDGRGIAHVWSVKRRKYAADDLIKHVGTVYGVHNKAEAAQKWAEELENRRWLDEQELKYKTQ